ncbi:MAG: lipid hydroperoxide peroxidase [Acidobacteria bacterium]|nr:MAG: lipid hydroperoxide peroxidase [Acidobacteriota bacterium]
MASITLKGNPIHTVGDLLKKGATAPDFTLTNTDLADVSLSTYEGKKKVLNIFPSLDTPVCATSVRMFNEKAASLDNTVVLCISRDLPFAHKRFCAAEGLENVHSLSEMHTPGFGNNYGVTITDGPLKSLYSRAVVVLDEENKVLYTQQVADIVDEPDYDAAIEALS